MTAKQSYAPFGSISAKKPKHKKQPLSLPGPGSYDVSLPLIAPAFETIRNGANNLIIKLNHLGTSSFKDKKERFESPKLSEHTGPGSYLAYKSKFETLSPKRERINASCRVKQLIKNPIQRSPTITQIKKVQFDDEIEMPKKTLKLTHKQKHNRNVRGISWQKVSELRSNIFAEKKQQKIGPGSYDAHFQKKKSVSKRSSPEFCSNSIRSFFDQIIFETNTNEKARQRFSNHYKSQSVGPGSYTIDANKEDKVYKYQFFGSTEDRL